MSSIEIDSADLSASNFDINETEENQESFQDDDDDDEFNDTYDS